MNTPVPISEWSALLHRRSDPFKAVAVLKASFDEVGIDPGATITSISGFVTTEEEWSAFEADWQELLTKHAIDHFHVQEWLIGAGEFQQWTRKSEQRSEVYEQFMDVIIRHKPKPIWSTVVRENWGDLETMGYSMHRASPYHHCFKQCVEVISGWSSVRARGAPVALVFADQECRDKTDDIHRAYQKARAYVSLAGIGFARMRCCLPLQAADILAYEMKKSMEVVESGANDGGRARNQ